MEVTGAPVGFAGPVGLKGVKILADNALKDGHDYVTGALAKDKHLIHVEIGRDCAAPWYNDFRSVVSGRRLSQMRKALEDRPRYRGGSDF